jgi:hypothetical protein
MANSCEGFWPAGTVGRVYSHHRSEADYSAAARLVRDSPPGARSVEVELLEDFYCLSAGETFRTPRRLFRPGEQP